MLIAKGTRLVCDSKPFVVEVENGARIPARTVVIATGAEYRRPLLKNLSRFDGAGVYYGATFVEAQLCGGEDVIVVGGGNSAGQAAVFLAETTKRVHMLVRSAGLAESMSRYLIRRIEETVTIVLRPYTEIVALEGGDHLESVRWRNNQTGQIEEHNIRHIFVMTGATPDTHWLNGCVALDAKGFIKTGPDPSPEDLSAARWPLARPQVMPALAKNYTVIIPDLPRLGDSSSSKPSSTGYDGKSVAEDIHQLVSQQLGFKSIFIVGHDIGAQMAYSYAAAHPTEVRKLVIIDFTGFLPGGRTLWWAAFHQAPDGIPEALVQGKEMMYL
jgi:hypothetical protein